MSTTHVKGPEALARALRKGMRGVAKKVAASTLKACRRGIPIVKKRLARRDTIKRGLEAEKTSSGARLRSTAPHSGLVEVGSRPHHVSMPALIAWAESKGVANPGAVAKAVQKKIAERGVAPTWFMRASIPEINALLDTILTAALRGSDA